MNDRGFTLVELLVTVIVLVVIAGVPGMATPDRSAQAIELGPLRDADWSVRLFPTVGDVSFPAAPEPHMQLNLLPAKTL